MVWKVFEWNLATFLPNVLPKVNYMFYKEFDDTKKAVKFGGYDAVNLLQSGQYGFKGFEVQPWSNLTLVSISQLLLLST